MPTAYIGRLAPSPTGLLHLGHAATFWTAYKRALAANGILLMRNEDLDPHRSRADFTAAMLEDLAWLGIRWTPPIVTQCERLPLYREALDQLLRTGLIYSCRCSRQDLARIAHAPHDDHAAQHPDETAETTDERVYPGTCRPTHPQSRDTFQPNTNYRLRVPDGETIRFTDRNLGPRAYTAAKDFGDFLIWRKDGVPSYQLACVVDDAAMGITEVVRGRDLLKSTARQILVQRALGLPTPAYFHTPLLADDQGVRLAKRHDALALRTLRQRGHSPDDVLAMFDRQPQRAT
jgi:glutamyl-queuosine tRNA(Asp) synthetase